LLKKIEKSRPVTGGFFNIYLDKYLKRQLARQGLGVGALVFVTRVSCSFCDVIAP
jgi:hypothetical protein